MTDITALVEKQRAYFRTGATLPVSFRQEMLDKLYHAVNTRKDEIAEAIKADLGKSAYESFMCETGLTLTEISWMRRHVRRLAAKHIVYTPLAQFASVSFTKAMPMGNVLIMSPWNYPILLTLDPLADAIAAGNTVILKPSAYSPATSALLKKLLSDIFPEEYIAVVTGGREENAGLLKEKFDLVFFTGSQAVGREVLRHTAEHLTPAVLELGGKSPCIVDATANIRLAAKRIVFGKYLNCGQTCVAPDYVLVEKSVQDALIAEIRKQIEKQYGAAPLSNPDYGRIVNEKHFDRLCSLIQAEKVVVGGQTCRETRQIAPTVMNNVSWDDPVMQQEIFGPLMPIIPYERFDDLFGMLQGLPKPLALYLFSSDKAHQEAVLNRLPSGGSCINDTIIHLATSSMGFGGVGASGMGAYHGKRGFEAFSHTRSVVDKKTWMDLPMRYQPYTSRLYGLLLKIFLR